MLHAKIDNSWTDKNIAITAADYQVLLKGRKLEEKNEILRKP